MNILIYGIGAMGSIYASLLSKAGNKVFVIVKGTAEGMDTMFGHYFEVEDERMKVMMTFDDTLTAYNAMTK